MQQKRTLLRPLTTSAPTGKVKIRLVGETEADVDLAIAELKRHCGSRLRMRPTEPGIAGAALPGWSAYGELTLELTTPLEQVERQVDQAMQIARRFADLGSES
jgi:hypothetical protein